MRHQDLNSRITPSIQQSAFVSVPVHPCTTLSAFSTVLRTAFVFVPHRPERVTLRNNVATNPSAAGARARAGCSTENADLAHPKGVVLFDTPALLVGSLPVADACIAPRGPAICIYSFLICPFHLVGDAASDRPGAREGDQ